MKLTAEEFINEVNGHNSWQHYPPSKQKVIGWLKQFAEIQVESINYSQCCTQLKDKEAPSFEDWIISNQIQKTGRLYFAKDGTEQDFNALHRRYVQTLQEQYF